MFFSLCVRIYFLQQYKILIFGLFTNKTGPTLLFFFSPTTRLNATTTHTSLIAQLISRINGFIVMVIADITNVRENADLLFDTIGFYKVHYHYWQNSLKGDYILFFHIIHILVNWAESPYYCDVVAVHPGPLLLFLSN